MRLPSLSSILLVCGIALVAYGYHLLSVPLTAGHDEVMSRARSGMFFVAGGGAVLMLWMAKR